MDHVGLDGPRFMAHHADPSRKASGGWQYPVVGRVVSFGPLDDDGEPLPTGTDAKQYAAIIQWANGDRRNATIYATGEITLHEEEG